MKSIETQGKTVDQAIEIGLYILASNVSAILLGEITTLIVDKVTKKKRLEVEASLEKEANRLIRKGHIKE